MLEVNLLVPEGRIGSFSVPSVQIPGSRGELGIGVNHAEFVTKARPGVLSFEADGETRRFFVSDALVRVSKNVVDVLASYMESQDIVDLKRAESSKDRALKRLTTKEACDIPRALASLERAKARLLLDKSK